MSAIADLSVLNIALPASDLDDDDPRLARLSYHAANSRAPSTVAAYRVRWNEFVTWCQAEGRDPVPAKATTIILFLDHLATERKLRYSTLKQAFSAIRAVHSDLSDVEGVPEAISVMDSRRVYSAMESIHRQIIAEGRGQIKKPRVFNQAEIEILLNACPDTPRGIQQKAVLALGFNAGLRAGEFGMLTAANTRIDAEGMELHIPNSKDDQQGRGETIWVGRLPGHVAHLDPVAALEVHKEANRPGLRGRSPLFVIFKNNKGGVKLDDLGREIPISRDAVNSLVRRGFAQSGLEETDQDVSAHSMRGSMITQAFRKNLSLAAVQAVTRHKNLTVLSSYNQQERREAALAPKLWE